MRFVRHCHLRSKLSAPNPLFMFFLLHFAWPKSLQCSLSWDNGTVRFLLRTVRAKVIYASRQKSERHFEARSIKRVLRLSKRRTNLTGVPWDDRDHVGVFWELAWGAIIPDRRKKNIEDTECWRWYAIFYCGWSEIEAYDYLLCQRGIYTFFFFYICCQHSDVVSQK